MSKSVSSIPAPHAAHASPKAPRRSLTRRILIGMTAGAAVGLGLAWLSPLIGADWIRPYLIDGALFVGAEIFMAGLKLLVVPLVFVSLVCGAASLDDLRAVGRLGSRTLALYLATTAFAVLTAVVGATLLGPGRGFALATPAQFTPAEPSTLAKVLIDIFPSNPFASLSQGNMLQIIVFALILGMSIASSGASGKRVAVFFTDLNEVVMKMVTLIMELAPWGVFCLMARVMATQGFDAILPMAKYFFTLLLLLAIHAGATYPILLQGLSGLSPLTFFRKFRTVMVFAFSTSSSNATLPVTMETVEHRIGVRNSIAAFTLPLGATVNMDGTAIMQGVATVFIAQAYGIDLSLADYAMVIVTATLASIGTAGVPGVGLVTLAMVLRQVNLPVEGIGLILGVDRLLDMARTVVNVTGDAIVTCIVAKWDRGIDLETYRAP